MSNQEKKPIRRYNTRSRRDTPLINPEPALNGSYWHDRILPRPEEEQEIVFGTALEDETIEMADDDDGTRTMSKPTFKEPGILHLLDEIFKDDELCQGEIARAFEEEGIATYDHFST